MAYSRTIADLLLQGAQEEIWRQLAYQTEQAALARNPVTDYKNQLSELYMATRATLDGLVRKGHAIIDSADYKKYAALKIFSDYDRDLNTLYHAANAALEAAYQAQAALPEFDFAKAQEMLSLKPDNPLAKFVDEREKYVASKKAEVEEKEAAEKERDKSKVTDDYTRPGAQWISRITDQLAELKPIDTSNLFHRNFSARLTELVKSQSDLLADKTMDNTARGKALATNMTLFKQLDISVGAKIIEINRDTQLRQGADQELKRLQSQGRLQPRPIAKPEEGPHYLVFDRENLEEEYEEDKASNDGSLSGDEHSALIREMSWMPVLNHLIQITTQNSHLTHTQTPGLSDQMTFWLGVNQVMQEGETQRALATSLIEQLFEIDGDAINKAENEKYLQALGSVPELSRYVGDLRQSISDAKELKAQQLKEARTLLERQKKERGMATAEYKSRKDGLPDCTTMVLSALIKNAREKLEAQSDEFEDYEHTLLEPHAPNPLIAERERLIRQANRLVTELFGSASSHTLTPWKMKIQTASSTDFEKENNVELTKLVAELEMIQKRNKLYKTACDLIDELYEEESTIKRNNIKSAHYDFTEDQRGGTIEKLTARVNDLQNELIYKKYKQEGEDCLKELARLQPDFKDFFFDVGIEAENKGELGRLNNLVKGASETRDLTSLKEAVAGWKSLLPNAEFLLKQREADREAKTAKDEADRKAKTAKDEADREAKIAKDNAIRYNPNKEPLWSGLTLWSDFPTGPNLQKKNDRKYFGTRLDDKDDDFDWLKKRVKKPKDPLEDWIVKPDFTVKSDRRPR
ncbi:MAG TPA: hypothetical protein VLJ15_02195 [Gammaproteobacteria bacterium]|nr:hypothetical protein [Gammaproteobacteria bacterium]